ncbi:MAG TPA: SIS domain-containing protein [Candidatus Sulfotelmatobacter sp.]|nr:SIS domain-containing protein [Candidatus Sulfotelmatobacter sp.]
MNKLNFPTQQSHLGLSARTPQEYYAAHQFVTARLPYQDIDAAINEISSAHERGASIFTLGNGGSAALASHFACDLGKGTLVHNKSKKRFRVISLTDNVPLITAWANDHGYEHVFAEQLENLIESGDVVFAISGSGNSPNVLRALEVAKRSCARTIGLTGFEGGSMKSLCDVCMILPSNDMQVIEDFHLSVTHAISSVIRRRICEGDPVQRIAATVMAD